MCPGVPGSQTAQDSATAHAIAVPDVAFRIMSMRRRLGVRGISRLILLGPPFLLSTLRFWPCGQARMTRSRRGSLCLHRTTFAFATSCRCRCGASHRLLALRHVTPARVPFGIFPFTGVNLFICRDFARSQAPPSGQHRVSEAHVVYARERFDPEPVSPAPIKRL
jgi:hypothetical protein